MKKVYKRKYSKSKKQKFLGGTKKSQKKTKLRKTRKSRKNRKNRKKINNLVGGVVDYTPEQTYLKSIFGADKVEKWGRSNAVHLVCGLAGEFCVLDTSINLQKFFPNSTVLFLDEYTQYAAYGLIEYKCNNQKDALPYLDSLRKCEVLDTETMPRRVLKLIPSDYAGKEIYLWIIDMQNDFCPTPFEDSPNGGTFAVSYSEPLYDKINTFSTDKISLQMGNQKTLSLNKNDGSKIIFENNENIELLNKYWTENKKSITDLIKSLEGNPYFKGCYLSRDYHDEKHCSFTFVSEQNPGYPAHCVQESDGAALREEIESKIQELLPYIDQPPEIGVIFKACHKEHDSYSAIPYHKDYPDIDKRAFGVCKSFGNSADQSPGVYKYFDAKTDKDSLEKNTSTLNILAMNQFWEDNVASE